MNLNEQLKAELLDEASWATDKSQRAGEISGRHPSNYFEKGIFRQLDTNNVERNIMEEALRSLASLAVVATKDTGGVFHYNAANRLKLQQKLREGLKLNYRHKTFLKTALKYGYEAAEELLEEEDDTDLDDATTKKLADIKKRFASQQQKVPFAKKLKSFQPQQQQQQPPQQNFQPNFLPPQQQGGFQFLQQPHQQMMVWSPPGYEQPYRP